MGHRVRVTFTEAEARHLVRIVGDWAGPPRNVAREASIVDKVLTGLRRPRAKLAPKVAVSKAAKVSR